MVRIVVLLAVTACGFTPGTIAGTTGPGDGATTDVITVDAAPPRACTLHLGSDHSCSVRTSDGTIHCVGSNLNGELGRGNFGGFSTLVTDVGVGPTIAASSRSFHACIAKADATVQCWGANDGGQLGDGTYTPHAAPAPVTGLTNVVELAVARSFSCARRMDNSVTCWGVNADGQLGDGTFTAQAAPASTVTALLSPPIAIAAGSSHACALLGDGTAACWGRNLYGQLGDTTQVSRAVPVTAPVTGIKQIAPSGYSTGEGMGGQTCALLTNGTVFCWGSNDFGQLGNGTMSGTPTLTPVQVAGITSGVEITMGRYHACVRLASGSVSCWGRNSLGEIGDNSQLDRATPTPVTLPRPAVHVSAGGFHTCALLDDNSAQCWGYNLSGQLGDGTQDMRLVPVASTLCPL